MVCSLYHGVLLNFLIAHVLVRTVSHHFWEHKFQWNVCQVQLLVSQSDVENYTQIRTDLDKLRLMVEKSELWVYVGMLSWRSVQWLIELYVMLNLLTFILNFNLPLKYSVRKITFLFLGALSISDLFPAVHQVVKVLRESPHTRKQPWELARAVMRPP